MNYTDAQLRLALAKMLPEKLIVVSLLMDPPIPTVKWIDGRGFPAEKVKDTEWLHVCWLVENTLSRLLPAPPHTSSEASRYIEILEDLYGTKGCVIATWQQRAIALAKVKGVEIV